MAFRVKTLCPIAGGGWVRFSYAGSSEEIDEAARRLARWLNKPG